MSICMRAVGNHLHDLIDERGVQIAGDEACTNALDLVWARRASRDDWRLCWLHCYHLGMTAQLVTIPSPAATRTGGRLHLTQA